MREVEMVEVKTADLIGPALDWAVAKAENQHVHIGLPEYGVGHRIFTVTGSGVAMAVAYRPSTDWKTGGPLIDKYAVKFSPLAVDMSGAPRLWDAEPWGYEQKDVVGETALIALCRAVTVSVLGEKVMVPKELTQ